MGMLQLQVEEGNILGEYWAKTNLSKPIPGMLHLQDYFFKSCTKLGNLVNFLENVFLNLLPGIVVVTL